MYYAHSLSSQKKKRGAFRTEVNKTRKVMPVDLSSSKKRKASHDYKCVPSFYAAKSISLPSCSFVPMPSVNRARPLKRCNAMEGLQTNWRAQAKHGELKYTVSSPSLASHL